MIQVFCPACENVVWVDSASEDEPGFCPECRNALHLLTRRKSRPPVDPPKTPSYEERAADTRVTPGPAPETVRKSAPALAQDPEPAQPTQPAPAPVVEEVPEDQGFCIPWGDPQTRYVPLPYRPDGGVCPVRFPLYVVALVAAGAALGWVASTVGQFYYFVLLFPLGVGIGLAGFGVLAGQLARVRSPLLGGLAGLASACAAIAAMHFCDYLQSARRSGLNPSLDAASFLGYLEATARTGLTISGRDDAGFNLGFHGTLAYWGVELLVVAGLVLFGIRYGTSEPYCSDCHSWKEERALGTVRESDETLRLMRQGNLGGLAGEQPARRGGELKLWVAVCPRCGRESPIDLRLERREARRGRPAGEVAHLTYPGEALLALEEVFVEPARAA
jgi:hypothetical protein